MAVTTSELGITVEELGDQLKLKKDELAAHREDVARQIYLVGMAYDRGGAIENVRKDRKLSTTTETLTEFHTQGVTLESKLDRPLTLPDIPAELLDPEGAKAIKEAGLRPYVIPGFGDLNPEELRRIADGEPSSFENILPQQYLAGIARGDYPRPVAEPYVLYVDRRVTGRTPTTKIAEAAGLPNLAHTPITEVRQRLRTQRQTALDEAGLDHARAVIKPISTREAGVMGASTPQKGEVITNTRIFSTDTYLAFDGTNVTPHNGRENGVPTRLTVVTRSLRPERYVHSPTRKVKTPAA